MADWGDAPAILIFGDTEEGRVAAAEVANAWSGRITAALPIEAAVDRLESQIAVDLVMLDVMSDHGGLLDEVFRRIGQGAAAGRYAAIATVAPELLDVAAARIGHEDVSLLVGRDAQALARAMAESLGRTAPQLREPGRRSSAGNPSQFADEIERDARLLAVALDGNAFDRNGAGMADLDHLHSPDASAIRGIIRARRLRSQYFSAALFADPAWDILLDLTAARIEGRSVAVSSLCIAASVPATTALRWIRQLTEAGLLRRAADPVDGRRVFIELTDSAAGKMIAYFSALSRGMKS